MKLDTIRPRLELVNTGTLNYDWADAWITSMKREANLAPSTIRHRHGALARCFDWMLRKHPEILVQNPLRLLRRGFATYTEQDAEVLARSGKEARQDIERDRRLLPGEEPTILQVLHGVDRTFFVLALETAMRMRECYTTLSDVLIAKITGHRDIRMLRRYASLGGSDLAGIFGQAGRNEKGCAMQWIGRASLVYR